jgi:hypothetical protein
VLAGGRVRGAVEAPLREVERALDQEVHLARQLAVDRLGAAVAGLEALPDPLATGAQAGPHARQQLGAGGVALGRQRRQLVAQPGEVDDLDLLLRRRRGDDRLGECQGLGRHGGILTRRSGGGDGGGALPHRLARNGN